MGQAIIGLGLVFLALKTIIEVTSPLGGAPIVRELFLALETAPLLAFIFAAMFAAITTSSAATIGIALALAGDGVLSLQAAMPIVLGANLGTTAAAFVSSFGGIPEAQPGSHRPRPVQVPRGRDLPAAAGPFRGRGGASPPPTLPARWPMSTPSSTSPSPSSSFRSTSLFGRLLETLVPDAPAEEGFAPGTWTSMPWNPRPWPWAKPPGRCCAWRTSSERWWWLY